MVSSWFVCVWFRVSFSGQIGKHVSKFLSCRFHWGLATLLLHLWVRLWLKAWVYVCAGLNRLDTVMLAVSKGLTQTMDILSVKQNKRRYQKQPSYKHALRLVILQSLWCINNLEWLMFLVMISNLVWVGECPCMHSQGTNMWLQMQPTWEEWWVS